MNPPEQEEDNSAWLEEVKGIKKIKPQPNPQTSDKTRVQIKPKDYSYATAPSEVFFPLR